MRFSRSLHPLRGALGALCLLLAPAAAASQASVPVPLEDPAYGLLDRLAAQLPLQGMIHGQRPYTRLEVARLALEAEVALAALARSESPPPAERLAWLGEIAAALARRFGEEEPGLRASLDAVRVDAALADSPFRGFTWNGLGGLENALVNPLLDDRHGREMADGLTLAAEADGGVRLGDRGAVWAGARAARTVPRGDSAGAETRATLRTGAARARLGGWSLQVGRGQIRRGQGRRAGMLFSDNAPALDMVQLQNDELFRFPWIFRHLGPARFSILFSDLGDDQNFPHAKLYSNWLTVRPHRRLEVGAGFIVQDGGEGGPEQSFWERVADYLILPDVLFHVEGDFAASNKIAGGEARLSVPEIGAALYGELYMDDFDVLRAREILWADAAHVFGLSLARLDGVGRLAGWTELRHTGVRVYRHYDYRSGVTRGRFLLGSALGSDALAFAGGLDWSPSVGSTLSLEGVWERRSHNEWALEEEPWYHFERVASNPEERRVRLELAWDHRPFDASLGWRVEAGGERVENFGFQEGAEATNAMLRLVLEWAPGR